MSALLLLCTAAATAADVELQWNSAVLADGYNIYYSTDLGVSWSAAIDVGNVLTYTVPDIPDTGIVLFRIGAYNEYDETVISWQGVFYCGEWMPPGHASGLYIVSVTVG